MPYNPQKIVSKTLKKYGEEAFYSDGINMPVQINVQIKKGVEVYEGKSYNIVNTAELLTRITKIGDTITTQEKEWHVQHSIPGDTKYLKKVIIT